MQCNKNQDTLNPWLLSVSALQSAVLRKLTSVRDATCGDELDEDPRSAVPSRDAVGPTAVAPFHLEPWKGPT